ncbi:MAG: DNA polymerase I [Acidobacteriota bacterium]|nr:DNA polymerase I [Acidobacteriota bacterium]
MAASEADESPRRDADVPGENRLYLIDGYNVIFRAFYALPPLSTSKGEPTNAVLGFVNMLRKLLREQDPSLVGVAWDVSSKTFRKEKFEDYKANRRPMPDDLRAQLPWIRRSLDAFRIPILEMERYEADDVLGTLAAKASAEGYDVVLVSADKDLMQLVGERTFMLHTTRDKLYDAALVEEDFGVPPEQVVEVLALMGDAVDNVPGVPGIGEKGAKKLIREHGSVEALIEIASELKFKKHREGLTEHADEARLSKELVTIKTDLDVDFDPKQLLYEPPDASALAELYRELEFFPLLKELEAEAGISLGPELAPATDVQSASEWTEAIARFGNRIAVAVIGSPVIGLAVCSLSADDEQVVYADFRTTGLSEAAVDAVRGWLTAEGRTVVGHDLKEVLRFAGHRGRVAARLADTMLLAYLLRSTIRDFAFEEVCMERLHVQPLKAKDAGWSKGAEPLPGDSSLLAFAAERAALAAALYEQLEEEMSHVGPASAALGVYDEIEAPLVPVLVGMEESGIEVDVAFLETMSGELATDVAALETEIYEIAGEQFNIGSPQQLGAIMFEKLDYPVLRRTRKTKSYATGADVLEELEARGFDLPERVLRYREWTKLKSTYVDALPTLVAEDGRIHTRYEQAVAATGRLSSVNPNLQNIPIRTEAGRRIRRAFCASEGALLLVADYSQIELRVLAHIAQEEALVDAFRRGEDIHSSTAALVFGGSPDLVTPDQRRAAKVINFGIIYGMSAFGLARNLGIEQKEAKSFIEAYFDRFPAVRTYTEETIHSAEQEGRVDTLYGRARWLPDIQSKNWNLRENAKRMAINARIQGTAADLLKRAMVAVDGRLRTEFPSSVLLLTVHDELVVEVPDSDIGAVTDLVTSEMEGVESLDVPLVVEAGSGPTWFEAKA